MSLPEPRKIDASGSEVVIRPAEASDAKGWIDLLSAVSEEGRFIALENIQMSRREMARHLRMFSWTPNAAAVVAWSAGSIVGQLTMFRDRGVYSHTAELGMSVSAPMRGKGVGTCLIEGSFDWASDFGIEKITLNVFPHNTKALSLYEKMGFVREGLRSRQAKLSYGYEDLIAMARFM